MAGALSPRLTRELLDRVNNPSTPRSEEENGLALSDVIGIERLHVKRDNSEWFRKRDAQRKRRHLQRTETLHTVHRRGQVGSRRSLQLTVFAFSDSQQISQSYHNGRTIPAKGDDVSIAGSDIPWDESVSDLVNGREDTLRPLNFNQRPPPAPRNGASHSYPANSVIRHVQGTPSSRRRSSRGESSSASAKHFGRSSG